MWKLRKTLTITGDIMNKLNEILLEELPDLKKHSEAFLNKELSKSFIKLVYWGRLSIYSQIGPSSFLLKP